MNKKLIIVLLCVPVIATAQPKARGFSFYAGPQASIAVGKDLSTAHSAGIGLHTQALYGLNDKIAVGARFSYTYLFGKTTKVHFYEPGGGNYGSEHQHDGMSSIGITGSTRFSRNSYYGGFDMGACLDFIDGDSQLAAVILAELGYSLNNVHALSLYFLLCGDPKMQIGARYSIRLGR
ncbi:MAG TPA: hypothetical protein VD993_19670 [Chitinophagaceae bacterium]|nr:hypothetical protein [Chitinophagaceae bacterium]